MDASDGEGAAPMRIAYFLHRFPHATETFITRELASLVDEGVDILIFSLMQPRTEGAPDEAAALGSRASYARSLGGAVLAAQFRALVVHPIRYLRSLLGVIRKTWREPRLLGLSLALFPRMVWFADLAVERGVDHVHAHFAWLEGIAAGVVRDLTGIGFSVNPHAFGLYTRPAGDVRALLVEADFITTISEYNRRHIESLDPQLEGRVEVIHCGVELDRYSPSDRTERDEDRTLRVVSVGRAVEKKGHEVLLRACRELSNRGVPYDCRMVVGEGGLRRELDALHVHLELDGSVALLDSMPEAGVRDELARADVFALACTIAGSGDRDGIPVVLMEAMAMEIPVLSTTVSGVPELVEDGVSGLLVEPGDPGAFADALERLGGDPGLQASMGRAGRRKVEEEFMAGPNARRLLGAFERSLGARQTRVEP